MSEPDNSENSRRLFLQTVALAGTGLSANWPLMGSAHGNAPPWRATQAAGERDEQAGCRPDPVEVAAAVERSLANILADGVDPNFPTPFELSRLKQDVHLQRELVETATRYIMQPVERSDVGASLHLMSVPKANLFGYRYFAQIDVVGAVSYLATAILIGRRLEERSFPVRNNRVFSHRFLSEGPSLLDINCNYGAFCERILGRLDPQQRTFLVSADIANFYPSVDDARFLQNLDKQGVEPWLTKTLGDLLLQWKPQWRQGIPVGPVASFLLGEAALLNVDAKLLSDGIDFIRYVDDFRFFADDMPSARFAIERLALHLHAEGLTLNQAKSSVEAVTRPEFEAGLAERRMARLWNQPRSIALNRMAQNLPAPVEPDPGRAGKDTPTPKDTPAQKDTPQQNDKVIEQRSVPCVYNGCPPLKKSQLDEFDLAFLDVVEPELLLAKLKSQAMQGRLIALGDFRAVIESACLAGDYALIGQALALLDNNPLCVIYLADVLKVERERIPPDIRKMASGWFATRLGSNPPVSDHEVMHIATLLGVDGYRQPEAVHAYLTSELHTNSSIALRALVAALESCCDSEHVKALLNFCSGADARLRRAVLDLSWPHLDRDEKMRIVAKHEAHFRSDPFLKGLLRGPVISAV
jgi:hypothetical protein